MSEGACVTYRLDLGTETPAILEVVEAVLAYQPRAELVADVERRAGLALCGAEAPPCVGDPP